MSSKRIRCVADFKSLIVNGIGRIPSWFIRKRLYCMFGMHIGSGSRILMGARIQQPAGIYIGQNTYINAKCHLDGRGGLYIGDNVNISNYSKIITASHDMKSDSFAYRTGEVVIDDYVWLGTGATVLDRSYLGKGMVLGAGSVFKGDGEFGMMYSGVPAKAVKSRQLDGWYEQNWKPYFI